MIENGLVESLMRYIGQTVTIFTTSGGLSGCGFTGTLAGVCGCTVRLITDIGPPPTVLLPLTFTNKKTERRHKSTFGFFYCYAV